MQEQNRMAKKGVGGAGGGGAGHIHTHGCVQIGLMSLCYKKKLFFVFSHLFSFHPSPNGSTERHRIYNFLSKYTCFERKVDIIQTDSVVQKHEYVQPSSPTHPPLASYDEPRPLPRV